MKKNKTNFVFVKTFFDINLYPTQILKGKKSIYFTLPWTKLHSTQCPTPQAISIFYTPKKTTSPIRKQGHKRSQNNFTCSLNYQFQGSHNTQSQRYLVLAVNTKRFMSASIFLLAMVKRSHSFFCCQLPFRVCFDGRKNGWIKRRRYDHQQILTTWVH